MGSETGTSNHSGNEHLGKAATVAEASHKVLEGDYSEAGVKVAQEKTVDTLNNRETVKKGVETAVKVVEKIAPSVATKLEVQAAKAVPFVGPAVAVTVGLKESFGNFADGKWGLGASNAAATLVETAGNTLGSFTGVVGVPLAAGVAAREGFKAIASTILPTSMVPSGSGLVEIAEQAYTAYTGEEKPHQSPYPSTTSLAKAHENDAPTFAKAPPMGEQFDICSVGASVPAQQPGFAPSAPVMTASIPRPPQVVAGLGPSLKPTGWG